MQTKLQRILVVDDQESFADAVAKALTSRFSYQAIACYSGRAAIELLNTEKFDVILLGGKIHEVTGLDVLRWMHELQIDTPVIMLTAVGSEDVALEAMKLGAFDYVSKDLVDIDHLPHLLNGVYERYLFRKEKERLVQESGDFEMRAAAVEMFHDTVASIAHHMKNALTFLELQILNQEYALKQFVPLESTARIEKAFADLHTEFTIITTGITALTEISDMLSRKPVAMSEMSKLQEDVQKTLADLKRLSSTVAWNG